LTRVEARRWRPTPLLAFSVLMHAAALVVLAVHIDEWPWVLGALVADHVLIGVGVLWPQSRWLGPNLVRLPDAAIRRGEVCLTFDDGPDPIITAQVLDILDAHAAKASFFCIAEKVASHPQIVREISRRGHSVENHSCHHRTAFAFYGWRRLGREIDLAQAGIAAITGVAPGFFRAPFGFRGPFLDAVLARRGLRYVSWTRRGFDTVSPDPDLILQRLSRNLAAGDVLLLHDSHAPVLSVLPRLLEKIGRLNLRPVALPTALRQP
jgi:peptidoglycan-N-acetylglucosamine deacetylase